MDSPSETRSPAPDSNQPSRANSVENTSSAGTPQQPVQGLLLNGADSLLSDPNRKPEPTDSLEQRVTEDPYDADAWLTLLNEAEREGEVSRVRDVYERFLKVYPTSVSCLFSLECFSMGICHHFANIFSRPAIHCLWRGCDSSTSTYC